MVAENLPFVAPCDLPSRSLSGSERRHSLVLAAYQLIAEKGFEGLRIRDVAAREGVNNATLHYYFPTKEALITAVVEYLIIQVRSATTTEIGTPYERLHAQFTAFQAFMRDEPCLFLVLCELLLRGQRNPLIYPILKQSQDNWQKYLSDILIEGIACGEFCADLDPQSASLVIISTLKGMILHLGGRAAALAAATAQLERWLKEE